MKLLILDGNSVINRAFFGVKPLTTREGLYTHAIYGFLNILERMEKEEQPEAVCVSFDLHGPTFRHKQYDGYKATRHPMPQELAQQMPILKDVLRAMRIPIYECPGWEADDVIGTVGKVCSQEGWECVIVTGDRDSLQLIDENVHVKLVISKPGQTTATLYTEEKFREEYGFAPKTLIDLKALMGDASDNIPGVAGVGPKTAKELLSKFGSLDGVYAHIDDPSIRPKLREKLLKDKDMAYLSYDLATIRPDAPISFAPKDAIVQPYNRQALYALFQKLEFVRLIDRYGLRQADQDIPVLEDAVPTLPRVSALPSQAGVCAVYLAADGSMGFAWADGVCALSPMEAQAQRPNLDGRELILHDCKTAWHRLVEMGVSPGTCVFDTALAAYDLNPSQSDYPVSKLAVNFLGKTVDDQDAAGCAEAMWRLWPILAAQLSETGMEALYRQIELPLCQVLYRMERRGICIDRGQLEQFGRMLSERIAGCENLIFSYSGEKFNINSTKQLGELLFEKLGLPPVKKTKTGYSTNADVLEKLKDKHPIVPAIMDYRMLTKLKSTYADGLIKQVQGDGRIHTTFQNLVTATGRLSSTEPNLQNIPVRTDLGAEIRKMFVPKPGCMLVDADYSQIELRVLAHIAGDEAMQRAFRSGTDIHTATAAQVFGVDVKDVTPLQRRHAKAVNFGIVYGISEFSLAEDIGVSRYEARAYIDNYLNNYRGVRAYMKQVVSDARTMGYTQTLYGRRRYIPELKSSNFNIRSGAERIALNTPIQGTAADIIKLAMIRVENALEESFPEAKLLLQVHDELIVECPEEQAPQVAQLVSREMEAVAQLSVPLVAQGTTRNDHSAYDPSPRSPGGGSGKAVLFRPLERKEHIVGTGKPSVHLAGGAGGGNGSRLCGRSDRAERDGHDEPGRSPGFPGPGHGPGAGKRPAVRAEGPGKPQPDVGSPRLQCPGPEAVRKAGLPANRPAEKLLLSSQGRCVHIAKGVGYLNILAIESSCDETAVAIVRDGRHALCDCIASQVALHRVYGGVVPEIASRKHIEAIYPLAEQALAEAGLTRSDIDAVAVTYAPGLIGAVLVGVNFAKGAALALGKPLIPVHHIRGHIAANYLAYPELEPPFLCLVVSGGHTMLVEVAGYTQMRILGTSLDDAAGECFDKVARVLGMPYPGARRRGAGQSRPGRRRRQIPPPPSQAGGESLQYELLRPKDRRTEFDPPRPAGRAGPGHPQPVRRLQPGGVRHSGAPGGDGPGKHRLSENRRGRRRGRQLPHPRPNSGRGGKTGGQSLPAAAEPMRRQRRHDRRPGVLRIPGRKYRRHGAQRLRHQVHPGGSHLRCIH